MGEILPLFGFMGIGILILFIWALRADIKDVREERRELTRAWERYYERSQEYKPIERFVVTFKDGKVKTVEGHKYSISQGRLRVRDEYDKEISIFFTDVLRSVEIERNGEVILGPKYKTEAV